MDVRSQYGHGYTFPCLFRVGDNGWVLVSETGVDSRYCGSRLSDVTEGNLYMVAFPMAEENNGNRNSCPRFRFTGFYPLAYDYRRRNVETDCGNHCSLGMS